jgi:hypothetical protein
MSKLIQRISLFIILVFGSVSIVLVALIYFGGNYDAIMVNEQPLDNPKITDTLLIWCAVLIGLAILSTVIVSLIRFVKKLMLNPKSAPKTIIPIIVFILVFVFAWMLGSDDYVAIIGYAGDENVGFWAHFTDMLIFASYTLFIAIALTIMSSYVYKKIK